MSVKEMLRFRVQQLLFDWQCCGCWQRFARIVELFIMDAFVDLFITLCIVLNTAFMAVDHAGMSDHMVHVLTIGNYVRNCIFIHLFSVNYELSVLFFVFNRLAFSTSSLNPPGASTTIQDYAQSV